MNSDQTGPKSRKVLKAKIAQWPSVNWEGNNQALTWALIELMEQKDRYRAGIWSQPGDKTVGKKKIHICTELAQELLGKEPRYLEYVRADPTRYGESVKQKLARLAKLYAEKKKELGQTGAGLRNADDIDSTASTKLQNLWDHVKQKCQYFYHLRDLLGERTNIGEHTRENSRTQVSTVVLDHGRQYQKSNDVCLKSTDAEVEEEKRKKERSAATTAGGTGFEDENQDKERDLEMEEYREKEPSASLEQIDLGDNFYVKSLDCSTILPSTPPPITPSLLPGTSTITVPSSGEESSKAKQVHIGSSSTTSLKRTLPSHTQHAKGGRDNELAEAWLTANMAKNERKRKRDELEQERLDRTFQREVELRRMEMAHEERMMEKRIELARLEKGFNSNNLDEYNV
ncbi:hypothetical protein HOY80DRAFT_1095120 [Tuber brumale]|nr:hypothetical protein HOY80DRAFT_1095120 [Tuber brumale]